MLTEFKIYRYAKLRDIYALSLATHFVDSITVEYRFRQIVRRLKEVYTTFQNVIQECLGCTVTLRRREASVAVKAPLEPEP